ncbi:MAG: CvpA family protein [Chloroflexi bacterium]|nr:CvpA family protein [Chloroflexota bacterium]
MHWLDLVLVGVIAWLSFRAFANGLIREAVTLAAVVGGVLIAGAFYRELSSDIAFLVEDETTRNFASFVVLFASVLVLGFLLALVLRHTAAVLMLGPLDHAGGAIFGFLKAVILVQALLTAVAVYPPAQGVAAAVDDSRLAPLLLDYVPGAELALPPEFRDALDQLERFRAAANQLPQGAGAP